MSAHGTRAMTRHLLFCASALLALVLPVSAAAQEAGASRLDPRIVSLIDQVSEDRVSAILRSLAEFETRNTFSTPDRAGKGVGAARQWILAEMARSSPRLQVGFDTYQVPRQGDRIQREVELRNVMAVLPGRSPRRIYVSGHYDSLSLRPASRSSAGDSNGDTQAGQANPADVPAPGVNDDGSGVALAMELARVFAESGLQFDATLVFIALAGEEQGLIGARLHAQKAAAEGVVIDAVFNSDMIGNIEGGNGIVDSTTVRVFSEGPEDSPSRQVARYIARHGARYLPAHRVRLIARHDRFGRGGDHTAFNQLGFAGVRFTEANENYSRQHTPDDTLEGIDLRYLLKNIRLNAAVVATLALAPPAPVVAPGGRPTLGRQPSGYDANLRWERSPGAVGYRIFWREAWTPDWQHELTVGDVTGFVLADVSIDDHVFGVAAVGPDGSESLVAAYVNPPRAATPVKGQ
jgi:hypothetical protein